MSVVRILISTNIELPSLPKMEFRVPEKPEGADHQIINNPSKVAVKGDVYKRFADLQSSNSKSSSSGSATDAPDLRTKLKSRLIEKIFHGNVQLPPEQSPKPIIAFPKDKPTFPVSLLHAPEPASGGLDGLYIDTKAEIIKCKLAEFGIAVDIAGYNSGPAVVQIKLQPQSGVKMAEIERLKNDLMGGLKTKTLRILAPIAGTEFVGIEMPNPKPIMVRLSEVL